MQGVFPWWNMCLPLEEISLHWRAVPLLIEWNFGSSLISICAQGEIRNMVCMPTLNLTWAWNSEHLMTTTKQKWRFCSVLHIARFRPLLIIAKMNTAELYTLYLLFVLKQKEFCTLFKNCLTFAKTNMISSNHERHFFWCKHTISHTGSILCIT